MKKINMKPLDKFQGTNNTAILINIDENGKALIKEKACAAGLDVSKYLRCCAVDEELFKIIDVEGNTAKRLIEAYDRINFCLREGRMDQPIAEWTIKTLSSVRTELEKYYVQLQINENSNNFTMDGDKQYSIPIDRKSAQLQFKVCEDLRDYIDQKAESLGMTRSQFLRVAALAEQQVVVLGKGSLVAKYTIILQDSIKMLLNKGLVEPKYHIVLKAECTSIFNNFNQLAGRLTAVSLIDTGYGEEVE